MTFYTNSRPEPPHGGYRPRYGLRTPRITVPHFADVAPGIPARWLRARGIPAVVGPTPARDERFRAVKSCAQTLKALHLEALPARKFCDPLERLLAVKRASLPVIFERNSERMRYAGIAPRNSSRAPVLSRPAARLSSAEDSRCRACSGPSARFAPTAC